MRALARRVSSRYRDQALRSTHGSAHPREVLRCSPREGRGEPQPLRFSPARPEANSCSRTRRGKCKGRRPPGLGGAPLSGEEGAGAGLYLFHLPIARGGQAGTASALRLPPSSFPSRAQGRSRRRLPPLLQQPTSNRPLGPTAQAPAPRRGGRWLQARTIVVIAAPSGHRALLSAEVLTSFSRSFPLRRKKIDSEPGVVSLCPTGGFTARAVCWG